MKRKLIIFGAVSLLALLLTTGSFAYTYTNSNTTLIPSLANGDFATYQVAPNQPDWNSILPGSTSQILIPIGCGDETQLCAQYPDDGSHWDKVDEYPTPDDKETYVSTYGSNSWKRDLYEISDANTTITTDIDSITVYYRFASGTTAEVQVKPIIKIGDEVYNATATTTTGTDFVTKSWNLTENPDTGEAWTWDEINALQAGIEMKGPSSKKPALCTQVYVQVNYESCAVSAEVPRGDLFIVTPDAKYTGDLLVKIYITNVADLSKVYKYLNMKVFVANTLEAETAPYFQVLSLENGVAMFHVIGDTTSSYLMQLIGGSYNLISDNPDDWGTGWSVTPEFYCEVSQR
jgi:hypothetical protein